MFDNRIYAVDVFMPALQLGINLDEGNHYTKFMQLIISVRDEKISRLLLYKKGNKFKEIITGIEIPHVLYSPRNCKYYLSNNSALYFRVYKYDFTHKKNDLKNTGIISRNNIYINLNRYLVDSDELESYIECKKDMSNYNTDKNYSNYVEAYKEEITKMFETAESRYKELLNKYKIYCDESTDMELEKVKRIRTKYKV